MWAWRLVGLEFGRRVNEDCWRKLKIREISEAFRGFGGGEKLNFYEGKG
jgi:hypothetical protein